MQQGCGPSHTSAAAAAAVVDHSCNHEQVEAQPTAAARLRWSAAAMWLLLVPPGSQHACVRVHGYVHVQVHVRVRVRVRVQWACAWHVICQRNEQALRGCPGSAPGPQRRLALKWRKVLSTVQRFKH